MNKKCIERWIKKNQDIIAIFLVAIGIGGVACVVGFYEGSQHATQFYNDTIAELNSRCIMLSPAAGSESNIKTTFKFVHGDEGVYRPEDWTMSK